MELNRTSLTYCWRGDEGLLYPIKQIEGHLDYDQEVYSFSGLVINQD